MPIPVQPDTTPSAADVVTWASVLGCSSDDAAVDMGVGLSGGVVTIVDSSDTAKRHRNLLKAILIIMQQINGQ